ncbi:hypothetical protein CPB83DRAFT_849465 [Crepidotus variabilis]|uniref:Nephrocystin 3-like N-terminal domain-containing protein n=1 Tax=Crepidotus variabilis TaxID=179855 RepID=A0A9P6JSC0_9AGAR|nr:hypothetical protein CPB83DRAFT_849465 [Crepidotus variabilis]
MPQNIGLFNDAKGVTLNNNHIMITQNHHGADLDSKATDQLSEHCAPGALLKSAERPDPPKCSEKTRVKLLIETTGWAKTEEVNSSAMWLTGSAGSGKTAISQTTAEMLNEEREGQVLSCHFFFRTSKDGYRSDGDRWVPNLVQQMICILPETRTFVVRAIERNNAIFTQTPEALLEELFLKPLCAAFASERVVVQRFSFRATFKRLFGIKPASTFHHPRLVVIDGLDECNDQAKQVHILKAIAKIIPKLPIPIRFLIASRPETHIRTTINDVFSNIPLHRINLDQDQDIRKDLEEYYKDRFDSIRRNHSSLTGQENLENWPSQEAIETLVIKSSTQFIFASTVMNYIEHPRHNPITRLERIRGIEFIPRQDKPFAELDSLYHIILDTVNEYDRRDVMLILTLIYLAGKGEFPYLELTASPEFLEDFLGKKQGDVPRLLDPLVSILMLPDSPKGIITMLHASFFDYFSDPVRSEEMTIRLDDVHDAITLRLFEETEKSGSWQVEGVLATDKLDLIRYHASQARLSRSMIIKLYSLQYNMSFIQSSERTYQDTLRLHGNHLYNLLDLNLPRAITKISDSPPQNERDQNKMVPSIMEFICRELGEDELRSLILQLETSLRYSEPSLAKISGRLTILSTLPFVRELIIRQGEMLHRHDFIKILEDYRFRNAADTRFAMEVVQFLRGLRLSRNVDRALQKRADELIPKWFAYTE